MARPSLLRIGEYLGERFPVPVTLILGIALTGAAYAAAQSQTISGGAPLILDGTALGGVFMVFLFLLHLRVFDEHKDFELDSVTRPDRPVQRGVISLDQLKIVGAIAIAGQIVLALLAGLVPAAVYAVVIVYSVLMLFEFFVKDWLEARLVWYALSHTLVMSILALALAVRFTIRGDIDLSPALYGLLVLCLTSFFAIDVLRKLWAPESEIEGLDSYSKAFGIKKGAVLGAVLIGLSAIIGGWVGWQLGGRIPWLTVVALTTLWGFYEIRGFVREPVARRAKRLELVGGVHHLVIFIGFVVVAGYINGVVFAFDDHFFTLGVDMGGS